MIIDMVNEGGWKNQQGTGALASCSCGSWKEHWEKYYPGSGIAIPAICAINFQPIWPTKCSVVGCSEEPTLGAHVINPHFGSGEQIVPMCASCNNDRSQEFNLKIGVICVSADIHETCASYFSGVAKR